MSKDSEPIPNFLQTLKLLSLQRMSQYKESDKILDDSISSLISELSRHATINYYGRNSDKRSIYPDDIDDTGSTLHVIAIHDKKLIHPELVARLIISLDKIRNKETPQLFNTWFRNDSQFESLDIVAHTSLAAFFDVIRFDATELKEYIFNWYMDRIDIWDTSKEEHFSEFYHSPYLPIYLLSRVSFSKDKVCILIKKIEELLSDKKNPDNALLVCAINFLLINNQITELVSKKLSTILHSYSSIDINEINVDNHLLYIERITKEKIQYATSIEFSKNIVFEAILGSVHTLAKNKQKVLKETGLYNSEIQSILFSKIDNFLLLFSEEKKEFLTKTIQALITSADYQIIKDLTLNKEVLTHQILGIFGYYLYDKLIDSEISIEFLPISNYCIRQYVEYIHTLSHLKEIESILTDMDVAYFQESLRNTVSIDNCHYKSMGTAIIPILLYPNFSKYIEEFFTPFQRARQICDDAKDIVEDMESNKGTTMSHFINNEGNIDSEEVYRYALCEAFKAQEIALIHIDNPPFHVLHSYSKKLYRDIEYNRFESRVLREIKRILA